MALDKILVIHLAGMGDLIMGRLALERLRQTYQHSRIVLLTWKHNLEAATLIPSINEFAGLCLGSSFSEIRHNLKVTKNLRAEHFNWAINAYQVYRRIGVFKLQFLLGRINPARSSGRDTDGKGWCFNQRIRESSDEPLHEVERQSFFFEQLGCRQVLGPAPLSISMADQQAADLWLTQQAIPAQSGFIAIHPGGTRAGHRWPAESFAEVARHFTAQGLRVVVTGGPNERQLAESVAALSQTISAAGKLSFGQLAHVLKRSRLFVTNDSGPMHLAAALSVPLVAIFGPGDPKRYGPYPVSRPNQVVIHASGDTLCFKVRCTGHPALMRLSAQRVIQTAESVLAGKNPAGIETA